MYEFVLLVQVVACMVPFLFHSGEHDAKKPDGNEPGAEENMPSGVSHKRKKHKKSSRHSKRRKTSPSFLDLEVTPSSLTESARNYFVKGGKADESFHKARSSSRKKSKHSHKVHHKKHRKTASRCQPLEVKTDYVYTVRRIVRTVMFCFHLL